MKRNQNAQKLLPIKRNVLSII